MIYNDPYADAVSRVNERIRDELLCLPTECRKRITEIRLRSGQPIMLSSGKQNYFYSKNHQLCYSYSENSCVVTSEEINDTFAKMCEYSVYSYQSQIKDGFITLQGGHRVGFGGTAVYNGDVRTSMRDISSINIRIARSVTGAADEMFKRAPRITKNGGVLVAGPPNSGKTTVLRDLARQLSNGSISEPQRVTVVDERGELAMMWHGKTQAGDDFFCDVLNSFPKADGILDSIRVLSPQVIVCDEIGSDEDARAIFSAVNDGVRIIASIHAETTADLLRRSSVRKLLEDKVFETVILLDGKNIGKIKHVVTAEALLNENSGITAFISDTGFDRCKTVYQAV